MVRRGDVFSITMPTQNIKTRSALIISNDIMNENSSYVLIAPINLNKTTIYSFEYVIKDYGKIMCDQIRPILKCQLKEKLFDVSIKDMAQIDLILKRLLGIY
ncbi:MAG: type II toxin-antitoxin system PemK/MazF family toxin [Nanoarchaeota archaeon]